MGRKTPEKDILADIDPDTALDILMRLAEEDGELKNKIRLTALELLKGVDVEEVATDLFFILNSLCVEKVWDNSGSTRYGYVDPTEYAWEMFENELEPFLKEMRTYRKLSMYDEAKNCCMGILLGIHRFEEKATTEFANWCIDAPHDYFKQVLDEWNDECQRAEDIEMVNSFAKERFKEWWEQWERGRDQS